MYKLVVAQSKEHFILFWYSNSIIYSSIHLQICYRYGRRYIILDQLN